MEVVSDYDKALPWLDWTVRLKIASEAAAALSFLHHECVPSLVHRGIQSSSILLDDKFEVRSGSLCYISDEEQRISQDKLHSIRISRKAIPKFLQFPKLLMM